MGQREKIAMAVAHKGATYSWIMTTSKVSCFRSSDSYCHVAKLWQAVEASSFHDDHLMNVTREINALLEGAAKKAPEKGRELCFLSFRNRLFPVWSTEHEGLTADDDPHEVGRALGLDPKEVSDEAGVSARPALPSEGLALDRWWSLGPKDQLYCYPNGGSQSVSKFWEAEATTAAHDETLMELTRHMNEILERASKRPPRPKLELSLIQFQRRYMLAWTERVDGVGPTSDPLEVAEVLRLKRDDSDFPL